MSTVYLDFRVEKPITITEAFLNSLLKTIPEFADALKFNGGFTYESAVFTAQEPFDAKWTYFLGRINGLSFKPYCNYYFIQLLSDSIPADSDVWHDLVNNAENQGKLLMNDSSDYVAINLGLVTGHENLRPEIIAHHFESESELLSIRPSQ